MGRPSSTLQASYGFFHSNESTLIEESQTTYQSQYKSGHIIFPKDILLDPLDYCSTADDVDAFIVNNPGVLQRYASFSLTEVPGSNGQSWYINDNGKWMKPIITPNISPHPETNLPSYGFAFNLYKESGALIFPFSGVWWIDAYQGIVKFEKGNTPNDLGYGIPKISCYVYTGQTLEKRLSNNFVYQSPTASVLHEVTHNLDSFALQTKILGYDDIEEVWIEEIPKVTLTNENQARIQLTEARKIMATFIRLD